MTEQKWLEQNSQFFVDDSQRCYLALFNAWRHGEVDMPLPSEDMLEAWEAEAVAFRKSIIAPTTTSF